MKNICFNRAVIIGIFISIICMFLSAYQAFGAECTNESVQDKVLNYLYEYESDDTTCEIDFAGFLGLSGFGGIAAAQIECTECKGFTFVKSGRMVSYTLVDDVLTVDGVKYVMGQSGNIYQITGIEVRKK